MRKAVDRTVSRALERLPEKGRPLMVDTIPAPRLTGVRPRGAGEWDIGSAAPGLVSATEEA
jgi:hypothetical protein